MGRINDSSETKYFETVIEVRDFLENYCTTTDQFKKEFRKAQETYLAIGEWEIYLPLDSE